MEQPQRVSRDVFMARVAEGVTEMDRLNREDERRLYITKRGMRAGGMTALVGLLIGGMALPVLGIIGFVMADQNASMQVRLEAGKYTLLAIPVLWLLAMAYYARWRLWRNFAIGLVATVILAAVLLGGLNNLNWM